MTDDPAPGAHRLPTLTEVVEFDLPGELSGMAAAQGPAPEAAADTPAAMPATDLPPALPAAPTPMAAVDTLVDEVLAELAPRIGMMFEARLREALAPALARAAEQLIRDSRGEFSATLRDLVHEAVVRAQLRRSGR